MLVNNAGVNEGNRNGGNEPSVVDLPFDDWRTDVETNRMGAFYCAKAVIPAMLSAGNCLLVHLRME